MTSSSSIAAQSVAAQSVAAQSVAAQSVAAQSAQLGQPASGQSVSGQAACLLPRPRLLLVHDSSTRRNKQLPERAGGSNWLALHERGLSLARARTLHEFELCQWLIEAKTCRLHARLGFASLREYAERLMGLSPRQCEERLRVGRALDKLPEVRAAFASGALVWSVVRELTRVATSETERNWLEWTQGKLASEVASEVATSKPGEQPRPPGEPVPPERVRHRLSFEVNGETLALFRQLEAEVRADLGEMAHVASGESAGAGGEVSGGHGDGPAVGVGRRAVPPSANGSHAEGRAAAAGVENAGGKGHRMFDSNAILFEIARRALDQSPQRGAAGERGAACGSRSGDGSGAASGSGSGSGEGPGAASGSGSGSGPGSGNGSGSESRGQDLGRARYQIAITRCDCCNEVTLQAAGRSHPVSPAFAAMAECDAQRLGDVSAAPDQLRRAKRSVPPMIHRAVMIRDHERCAVPGCRNHHFLDVHHVKPRADGGTHEPEWLMVLCGAHHLACHDGLLIIDGNGTRYGKMPNAAAQDIAEQVLDALTRLSFPRKEAEALLRHGQQKLDSVAGPAGNPAESPAAAREALLRAALSARLAKFPSTKGRFVARPPGARAVDFALSGTFCR